MLKRTKPTKAGVVKVTFALPLDAPDGPVSVVGDFNDWTPGVHLLTKRSNGLRTTTVQLPAGSVVRFRYLGVDGHWFDDHHADGIDQHGSLVAV